MAAGNVAAHIVVTIKFEGTPTSMPAEAMSQITGKYYRVTNSAKRCFDPRVNLLIQDNAVDVAAADIEAIDYLNGIVKFAAAYTVVGAVTVSSGSYLPFSSFGTAKSFSAHVMREKLDKSVFGNSFRRYILGLMDFDGDVGAFSDLSETVGVEGLGTSLNSATLRVISIEIIQDGSTLANGGLVFRGLVNLQSHDTKADVASIVESGIKFLGKPQMSTNSLASGSWPVSWSLLDGATGLPIGV